MPPERAIDIDDPHQLGVVKLLLEATGATVEHDAGT
jgi:hypothetical protein